MLYSLAMETITARYHPDAGDDHTTTDLDGGVGALLLERRLTIATAESCTGGLVSARITSVAGSSAYFLGGIVSYSNDAKHRLLGVPNLMLERYGAVSADTALAMARGVRRSLRTDIGVATTGIAGPGGATETKPVGLVYVALAAEGVERCRRFIWPGDRLANITASAEAALRLVRAYLEELR
jgi:PncC family amidohydrolase